MLNYANLNDVEFEALCQDVMERKLKVRLRRFAPGRDGGVDLTDDTEKKNIIVQVKHYQKSTPDALIRSLKNDLPKLAVQKPKKYYICCSRELSHEKINELFLHFRDYMDSDAHIITILEIDDFLKKPENQDILKKHFKLWLDSTGILDEIYNDACFVDCEAFLSDVDDLHKLFVRTSAFDQALKALETNHTLCIIGNPGVGKSITSKMLVLHYATQGYRVRYTTDVADLTTLKASLRRDQAAKEIILLDDCFGQAYFEMKSSQSSELISLIKYIRFHTNKILILNSRVTIFKEARERQRELIRSLERKEFQVFILDMSNLSREEKAKIFYNHLAFSRIPDDYFENIRTNFRYREIISHKNYNPRIIEFICKPSHYQSIAAKDFYSFIEKQLNNPQEMWKDEYEDRLQLTDRILLQTVYSLTKTSINLNLVQQCFNRRIATNAAIDKTVDQFSKSLLRLSEGFVTIIDNNGERYISMQNPSVNDFLDGRLKANPLEKNELIQSICSIEQMRLLPSGDYRSYAIKLLESGEIERFIFLNNAQKSRFIASCILSARLCIERFRPELLSYIETRDSFVGMDSRKQVKILLLQELWECYNLKSFFLQPEQLYSFLHKFDLEFAVSIINGLDVYFHDSTRGLYAHQVQKYLKESYEEFLDVDASDYENTIDIESIIRQATYSDSDNDEVYIDEDEAVAALEEEIAEEVIDNLNFLIRSLPEPFSNIAGNFDIDDVSVSSADYIVDDFISNPLGNYDPDIDKVSLDNDVDDYSAVDAIFQR